MGPCAFNTGDDDLDEEDGELLPFFLGRCTNDSAQWVASIGVLGCDGHIIFEQSVGFTGEVYWIDHDAADDDYNFKLVICDVVNGDVCAPNDSAGLNASNGSHPSIPSRRRALHMEFDSEETVDIWEDTWWGETFHRAVDFGGTFGIPEARRLIDGSRAIAYGKWGMDCYHRCKAELHPVLGLAVRTGRVSARRNSQIVTTIEDWQVFYRSQGNHGSCGIDPFSPIFPEGLRNATARWIPADLSFRFPAPDWGPSSALVSILQGNKTAFDTNPTTESVRAEGPGFNVVLTLVEHYWNAWWTATVRIEWQR